jgi:hypothetical protein
MGRRKGWDPHDASAGLRRMGLGFIVLPAITMLEGGSCPILLKKSISRTLAKFSVLMGIYYAITFRFLRHA